MYLLWKVEHKLVEQIETRYYLHFRQMTTVTEAHIGVTSPGLGLVKPVCNGIDQNFDN
jgi:hypothetical protein